MNEPARRGRLAQALTWGASREPHWNEPAHVPSINLPRRPGLPRDRDGIRCSTHGPESLRHAAGDAGVVGWAMVAPRIIHFGGRVLELGSPSTSTVGSDVLADAAATGELGCRPR